LTWPYLCFERLPDHFTEEGLRFRLQREGNTAAFISVAVSAVLCWKRLLQARPVFSSSAKETGPLPGLNIEQEVVARSLFQCFAQSPLSKACVILGKSGTGKTRFF
jgi:Cdc6-like AAA superfamily ATPase